VPGHGMAKAWIRFSAARLNWRPTLPLPLDPWDVMLAASTRRLDAR